MIKLDIGDGNMYCEKCGMYISDRDKGCINCINKNKNNKNDVIKWVIIIVGILVLIYVIWFGVSYFYLKSSYQYLKDNIKENWENDLIVVPYAVQDIEGGSMIYSNMVSFKNYMKSDLPNGGYYLRTEDIIGKCVDYDVIIDENSLFYEDMLVDCDWVPEGFYSDDE